MSARPSTAAGLISLLVLTACPDEPRTRAASPVEAARRYPSSSTSSPSRDQLATFAEWTELVGVLEAELLDRDGQPVGSPAPLSTLLPTQRPLVIQIFATYCPPCLAEMPMFDALFAEGYAVLGLSMDAGEEEALRAVLERQNIRYPVVRLTESSMSRAGAALEAGLPTTLIVGPGDRVAALMIGKVDRAEVLAGLARARPLR